MGDVGGVKGSIPGIPGTFSNDAADSVSTPQTAPATVQAPPLPASRPAGAGDDYRRTQPSTNPVALQSPAGASAAAPGAQTFRIAPGSAGLAPVSAASGPSAPRVATDAEVDDVLARTRAVYEGQPNGATHVAMLSAPAFRETIRANLSLLQNDPVFKNATPARKEMALRAFSASPLEASIVGQIVAKLDRVSRGPASP